MIERLCKFEAMIVVSAWEFEDCSVVVLLPGQLTLNFTIGWKAEFCIAEIQFSFDSVFFLRSSGVFRFGDFHGFGGRWLHCDASQYWWISRIWVLFSGFAVLLWEVQARPLFFLKWNVCSLVLIANSWQSKMDHFHDAIASLAWQKLKRQECTCNFLSLYHDQQTKTECMRHYFSSKPRRHKQIKFEVTSMSHGKREWDTEMLLLILII